MFTKLYHCYSCWEGNTIVGTRGGPWVIFHHDNKLVCKLKSVIASYSHEINQNLLCALPLLLTI
jgi:hypothetical protein